MGPALLKTFGGPFAPVAVGNLTTTTFGMLILKRTLALIAGLYTVGGGGVSA